jgi:hypothetical protein
MRHLGAIIGMSLALLAAAACGGKEEGGEGGGAGAGGGGGGGSTGAQDSGGSNDGGSTDAEPSEAASTDAETDALAALCTKTGGNVVDTFCFANPPFQQYTCATGENGAICDPGPGQSPTTPECTCPGSECFDPLMGCTAVH